MSYITRTYAAFLPGKLLGAGLLGGIVLSLAVVCWPSAPRAEAGLSRTPMPGVTVSIVELKRIDDKAVGLVYAVKNGTGEKLTFDQLGLRIIAGTQHVAGLVSLVDFKNGKRYGVGRAGSNCLCSAESGGVPPGGEKQLFAQFAAPPADVDKIAVLIGDVPPFYDVPIQ